MASITARLVTKLQQGEHIMEEIKGVAVDIFINIISAIQTRQDQWIFDPNVLELLSKTVHVIYHDVDDSSLIVSILQSWCHHGLQSFIFRRSIYDSLQKEKHIQMNTTTPFANCMVDINNNNEFQCLLERIKKQSLTWPTFMKDNLVEDYMSQSRLSKMELTNYISHKYTLYKTKGGKNPIMVDVKVTSICKSNNKKLWPERVQHFYSQCYSMLHGYISIQIPSYLST